LDGSEFSVFLFDEEEGRGVGAFGRLDGSSGGMFFEEFGEFSLFGLGEADSFADEGRWCSGLELDGVVPGSGGRQPFSFSLFEYVAVISVL